MITRTDIINLMIRKYSFSNYLEIGVRRPSENFDLILSEKKHSVDPAINNNNYTYNMTSDEFFDNHIKQKYDIIFIDGMHTEEQSYKDVKNSIKYLNENGVIIMHDCNPAYKYLTRSYEEYLNKPGGWNGTVYKAYIKLKRELKDWTCFVVNENYGCGIITKNKLIENKMLYFDIDNFSWDFFDKNRKEILQLISFEEYKKLLEL